MVNSAISQYQKLTIETEVDHVTPVELIQLLFNGASNRLQRAKGCILHDDIAGRSNAISSAVAIFDGLQASLDHDKGGEIAGNLEALYDYMQRRLFRANADNDIAALNEVISLLDTLRDAWDALHSQQQESNLAAQ